MKNLLLLTGILFFFGCSVETPNYENFRQFQPKSIVVMPPINLTNSVKAPELFLAVLAQPIGEAGYYVFPPLAVLKYFQSQGIPFGGEAGNISYQKLREVFGADAALYSSIEAWGEEYQVITAHNEVKVHLSLVDLKSGNEIWAGEANAISRSRSGKLSDMLVGALVHGLTNSSDVDDIHLARQAAMSAMHNSDTGLIYGPHRPNFSEDLRGR